MTSTEVEDILKSFWEWRLRESPEFATQIGVHTFDNALDDHSLEAYARRQEDCREFLEKLKAVSLLELSKADVLNVKLLRNEIETFLDGSKFKGLAAQFIALLQEGVRTGHVPPHLTVNRVPDQIMKLLNAAFTDDNLFFKPLKEFPEAFSEKERESIKERGIKLIEENLKPSFKTIYDYYLNTYLPQSRQSIACSDLPSGLSFYNQSLKFHIACELTPNEVHELGQSEVRRIRSRMDEEELLNGYKKLCDNKIKPKLKDFFKQIPEADFEIKETPTDLAPVAPGAYYLGPSDDGTRPGVFMVNTYKPETRPKYEMVSLALHEAVPGHHLQTVFAMEQRDQPSFRRFVEDRRYYEAPSRFALHTAYMEGWGLYSEYLGEEMGLYQDPYDLFGRLSNEIFRACRLVVDTGMHALGWSRQKAVDFMVENTAMSLHNVNAEINRYIIWPGQACAYKVGEIKIKELRNKTEQKLGEKFDVKDYHHVFLSAGPMGLDTLEEAVDKYIESTLAI
ncbi:hypothetical protein P5673_022958 [Acropora cervicornis]|uniref:DUF885 domain-containing protein n=1 Tax=Acropora cervicornis TaxID=6130 RepID=A0AAD9Q647_ACRCE|nr:hypothetical protein P5673_022958 [Acropora cervicornis]